MQKIIKKNRKKGFTLVELLIVIIIIGILAGMMMLSTGAATDKAEATKILSNMRNIKAATIMYYSDNNKWPDATGIEIGTGSSIDEYLDSTPTGASYDVKQGTAPAKAIITASNIEENIGKKLKGLEGSAGISVDANGKSATMEIK